MTTHFFIHASPAWRDFFFLCGDFRDIFHRNTSAEVGGVVRVEFTFGQFQVSHEAVVNCDPLGFILARALGFIYLDAVNQFTQNSGGYDLHLKQLAHDGNWTGMELNKRVKGGIVCIRENEKGYHNGKDKVQRRNEASDR